MLLFDGNFKNTALLWLSSCWSCQLQYRRFVVLPAVLPGIADVADTDLCWQYLYHQVHQAHSTDAMCHTELATVLLDALAVYIHNAGTASMPDPEAGAAAGGRGGEGAGRGYDEHGIASSTVSAAQLTAMVPQLPICFAPNQVLIEAGSSATRLVSQASSNVDVALITGPNSSSAAAAAHSGAEQQHPADTHQRKGGGQLQAQQWQRLPLLMPSGSLPAAHHSRHASLVGVGVPSASFFAASVAAINRRTSRDALLSVAKTAGPAAPSASLLPPESALINQQQHSPLPWMQQQQQQRRRQQRLGALAGDPVAVRAAAAGMSRQGSATAAFARLSTATGAQGTSASAELHMQHTLGSSVSSIAQLLQQQQGSLAKQLSTAGSLMKAGSWQQQPQHNSREEAPCTPALRCLPGSLGPWPLERADQGSHLAPATPAAGASSTAQVLAPASNQQPSGSSSSNSMDSTGRAAAAAAAALASDAVHDKVLLLRCLLVYHLQTSLLYDVQVGQHC